MGVYTNVEKTLGLRVTKKLINIRDKFEEGITLEKEDIIYLLNESARFETLDSRLRSKTYKVADRYSLDAYEIEELVGNIMTELRRVRFMNVEDKRKYRISLSHLNILGGQRMSIEDVMSEIDSGVLEVRLLQENFDANKDDYQVIGTFDSLKKDYSIDMYITTEDKVDDIKQRVKMAIKGVLDKELEELKNTLEKLN